MASATSLTFATLNVRGFAAKRKQSQVHRILTDHNIDLLAIQETKVEGEQDTESIVQRFTSRFYAVVSHAVGTSAGCIVFIKKLPSLEVQAYTSCPSGRCVVVDFAFACSEWRLICVYAPNVGEDRVAFLRAFSVS